MAVLVVALATLGAAAVATALVLTGCGRHCPDPASGSTPVAAPPVATPDAARRARTPDGPALAARITRSVLGEGGGSVRVRLLGRRTTTAVGVARWLPGAGPAQPELSLSLTSGSTRTKLLSSGDRVFFAPPRPVGGRSWISMPRGRPLPLVEDWSTAVREVTGSLDPWRSDWRGARVGRLAGVPVEGVPTRRFVVRLPGSVTVLDLDDRDLPVRVVAGGTTVTYAGWGGAVDVAPPPAADVVEAEASTG